MKVKQLILVSCITYLLLHGYSMPRPKSKKQIEKQRGNISLSPQARKTSSRQGQAAQTDGDANLAEVHHHLETASRLIQREINRGSNKIVQKSFLSRKQARKFGIALLRWGHLCAG
jgi:hypothetical protein